MSTGKLYADDYGVVIKVSTGIDLTSATSYRLLISKPNGATTDWIPTVDSPATAGILSYTTVVDDLAQPGTYKLQARVNFASGSFLGETATFKIYKSWE